MKEQAREFAIKSHGNQKYGKHPYCFHLDAVAEIASAYGDDTTSKTCMNSTEARKYSIWLLPQDAAAGALSKLIEEFSRRFDTPDFLPHATLCSGSWSGELSALVETVDQLAGQSPAIKLKTNGPGQADTAFQFFYIALAPKGFDGLATKACGRLSGARLPAVGPHVSLIYCDDVARVDRRTLTEELVDRIPDEIVFNSLALVLPGNNDWARVEDWRIEYAASLGG